MSEKDLHVFEIAREGLCGQSAVDEQTFASVSILAERLERVQSLGKGFSAISFSPGMEELAKQGSITALC